MSRAANGPHKIWDLDLQEDKTGASNYWRIIDKLPPAENADRSAFSTPPSIARGLTPAEQYS
jgi:hypothetical protein